MILVKASKLITLEFREVQLVLSNLRVGCFIYYGD